MSFIEIRDLHKNYGEGEGQVQALKYINLEIEKGEFVAIVGASGSGKSTLLHMIGGVDRPSFGEIFIDGRDISKFNEEELSYFRLRKIGFVFQFFNLLSVLTVEENIEMPVLLDNGNIDRDYLNDLIKLLSLEDKRDKMPYELSGGQQQRVCIGRALANKPSIILADEPTGNLDSKTARDVMELLKYSARKYNQTLILITHDEKIANMADRVVKIKDGTVCLDEDS